MRSLLSFHSLLCLPLVVQALHLQLAGRQLTADADGEGEHSDAIDSTTRDILYIANVTIDGVEYPLQMDTGSSDIWVNMEDNEPSNLVSSPFQTSFNAACPRTCKCSPRRKMPSGRAAWYLVAYRMLMASHLVDLDVQSYLWRWLCVRTYSSWPRLICRVRYAPIKLLTLTLISALF